MENKIDFRVINIAKIEMGDVFIQVSNNIVMVLKMYFKVYPKQGMSKDKFVNYWLNIHAPIAKQLPGLRKYVIDIILDTDGKFALFFPSISLIK